MNADDARRVIGEILSGQPADLSSEDWHDLVHFDLSQFTAEERAMLQGDVRGIDENPALLAMYSGEGMSPGPEIGEEIGRWAEASRNDGIDPVAIGLGEMQLKEAERGWLRLRLWEDEQGRACAPLSDRPTAEEERLRSLTPAQVKRELRKLHQRNARKT